MTWKMGFDPGAERELSKLDPPIARRLLGFLRDRLATLDDPRSIGEALKGVSSRNGKNRTLSLRGSQQGKDNGARYCARVL